MPSKAATAYNMKRLASIRHPANHSASTVPNQASPSERAIRLVFIETVNASPSKSPAVNARPTVARPATRTVSTVSQSAVQRSSARYSTEVRKNGGIKAASKAVQSAIRGEKMETEIFQTHQIVAAKRGSIASNRSALDNPPSLR